MTTKRKRRKLLGCTLTVISLAVIAVLLTLLAKGIHGFVRELSDDNEIKREEIKLTKEQKAKINSQLPGCLTPFTKTAQPYLSQTDICESDIFYAQKNGSKIECYLYIIYGRYAVYKGEAYELASDRQLASLTLDPSDMSIEDIWFCPKDKNKESVIKRRFPKKAKDYALNTELKGLETQISDAVEKALGVKLGKYKIEVDSFGTVTLSVVNELKLKNGEINYTSSIVSQESLQ